MCNCSVTVMLNSVRVVKHGLFIVHHHSPQDTHHQEKTRAYLHSLNKKNKHELFFKYNRRSLSHTVGEGGGGEGDGRGWAETQKSKVVALVSTGKNFRDIQETVTTFLVYNID